MIKRLKKLWKLANKDEKLLNALDGLSDKEIMELPDEDTQAVFYTPGNDEDYDSFIKQQSGIKKWYDRIKDL